jgi:hypothetical protein
MTVNLWRSDIDLTEGVAAGTLRQEGNLDIRENMG